MTTARALAGSIAFVFIGPGLEAGLGPYLITGGFQRGDGALDTPAAIAAGAVLIALGLLVIAACFVRFVSDGTGTPSPLAPPQELVARGPYRYVRNPMYVATAAVILGEGLLIARPILVLCAGLYVAALAGLTRFLEEPLLAQRFGPAWGAYAAEVPGWIPRRRGA
ncbi:MAG: isoprenylcysteine carboxylmethyltransferase family protein [Solirubrobacteraceae bacterium]|nr:isoprenylcysteine carboxylmethyltransferase family protein [Solirubrobacteraceae bacterium]